jgi:predicted  nucleic acid-binding Zn-ribbon protein
MTAVEKLKINVQHMSTFLEAAKASLSSEGAPEQNAVDAARLSLEAANEFMPKLMQVLEECKQEVGSPVQSPWDDPAFSVTR